MPLARPANYAAHKEHAALKAFYCGPRNGCMLRDLKHNLYVIVAQIYLPDTGQRRTLTIIRPAHFHCNDYFEVGGIRIC